MEHFRYHRRSIAGFVTLLGLILGSGVVLAADDKLFAPQICVPVEGSDGVNGVAEYRVDAVEQIAGAGYQVFICPLVRDVIAGELASIRVWVGNAHPKHATAPECCVYSLSPSSNFWDYACAAASDEPGRQTLDIGLADFEEATDGLYVLTCDLGFGDTIHGIRTREE